MPVTTTHDAGAADVGRRDSDEPTAARPFTVYAGPWTAIVDGYPVHDEGFPGWGLDGATDTGGRRAR